MKLLKLSLQDFQTTQNYAQSIVSIHICRPTKNRSGLKIQQIVCFIYIKRHRPVTTASVARWIRAFLTEAGIDTSVFKTYSNANAFVPVHEIVKMTDWSNVSISLL